ncbi:uncharacterized protein LOC134853921 isoform X2 [Symsagittifera roscoffensis]|uniref:uncharacterized protein LOC134853921 isoform X2 n=2 Tax=Symsagittifera roscoffensis TaxID=84072 RepID=UPI00307C4C15
MIWRTKRAVKTLFIVYIVTQINKFVDAFFFYLHSPSQLISRMNHLREELLSPVDSNDQFITFDLSPSEPSLPKDFKPLIIHMFRAYHDTRLVADRTRVTALLLVENSAVSHISSPDRPQLQELFCLVNETNVKALVHKMGIMYKFQYKGAIFGEFILRCEINTTQPVENFQIVWNKQRSPVLPVEQISRPREKRALGFCGSNWYHIRGQESTSVSTLIEWFEYHKYMGVEKFHVRVSTEEGAAMAPEALSLVQLYREMGVVELQPAITIPTPSGNHSFFSPDDDYPSSTPLSVESQLWVKSQSLQLVGLNDCLHRNMFKYQHILIIDTDELLVTDRIVPKALTQLVQNVTESTGLIANLRFRERRFYKNCDQFVNTTQSPLVEFNGSLVKQTNLLKFKSYAKSYLDSADSKTWRNPNAKSIICPEVCAMTSAHRCTQTLEEYSLNQARSTMKRGTLQIRQVNDKIEKQRRRNIYFLDPRHFGVHHYRQVDGVRDKGIPPKEMIAQYCEKVRHKSANWELGRANMRGVVEIGHNIQYMEHVLGVSQIRT